jgi:hypothetical protein
MPCPYIWGGVQGHGMPCPFPLARWRERGTQGVRAQRRCARLLERAEAPLPHSIIPLARWRERGTQGVRAKRRACPREFVNLFKHRKPHQRQGRVGAGERRIQPVRRFVCHKPDGGQPLRRRLLDLRQRRQHRRVGARLDDPDGMSPLQPDRRAVGRNIPQQHIGSSWRNLRVAQRAKGYPPAQRNIKGRWLNPQQKLAGIPLRRAKSLSTLRRATWHRGVITTTNCSSPVVSRW